MPITRLRGDLQIKADSVTSDRIRDFTVSGVDIAPGTISEDKLSFTPSGSQWIDNGPNIYFDVGNVGIGTLSPNAVLHVAGTFRFVDGSQAAGKVLTSDVVGLSSWADPAAVLARIVTDGENVLVDDDGNVIFTELL